MVASLDLCFLTFFFFFLSFPPLSFDNTLDTNTNRRFATNRCLTWLRVSTNLRFAFHKGTRSLGTRETRKGRGKLATRERAAATLLSGLFFHFGRTPPRSTLRSSILAGWANVSRKTVRSIEIARSPLTDRLPISLGDFNESRVYIVDEVDDFKAARQLTFQCDHGWQSDLSLLVACEPDCNGTNSSKVGRKSRANERVLVGRWVRRTRSYGLDLNVRGCPRNSSKWPNDPNEKWETRKSVEAVYDGDKNRVWKANSTELHSRNELQTDRFIKQYDLFDNCC